MVIRRIGSADAAALRELRLRALADAPEAFTTTLPVAEHEPPEFWETWARDRSAGHSSATFVAVDGARWHGMVSGGLHREDSAAMLVFGLWVAPEVRRSGIATALMEMVGEWARAAGKCRLALGVYEDNVAARRLYERLGFAAVRNESASAGRSPLVHLVRDL